MVKILIVDDEIFARDAMAKIIVRKGFEVLVASTGEECIKLFKSENPQVIFLDIILPDLDGDHVYTYLKEIKNDVVVYFITGSGFFFTEENAMKAGASGYLQKPIEMQELFKVLDDIKKKFGD
ncbi:MAG: response regulator [Endomicrobiaceae bacterium]